MENILLMKDSSQYDAMRIYVDECAEAFRKLGFSTLVVDTTKEGAAEELMLAKAMNFQFAMSFNAVGLDNKLRPFLAGIPQCTYLCDHPASHASRLINGNKNDMVVVCDDNFRKYGEKYFRIGRGLQNIFVR